MSSSPARRPGTIVWLLAGLVIVVVACSGGPSAPSDGAASPAASIAGTPLTEGSPSAPDAAESVAGSVKPATDWENPDSDPALRASHEAACRASDAVPAELWASLVRVVEQQRSGWPFHLYWDGDRMVVTCYALPDAADQAGPAVVAPVTNAGGHRGAGDFAAFESTLLLNEYERWMGWGTTDPAVAALRVTPREGPGVNATVNNGFFLVQWPLGMDRRQPRLSATDGCGEALVNGQPAPPCVPA